MYIETPAVIPVSVLDFAQFTNGMQSMDLVDITFMGSLSQNITAPQALGHQLAPADPSTTDPRYVIIDNPGSYVYRLDLTLDSEKLLGSEVEGISVEISPVSFDLHVVENYEDIENISNKALIIAKELQSQETIEKLEVMIDYRSDLSNASHKTLADSALESSDSMEQKVFFSSAAKTTSMSPKIPIIASTATAPITADDVSLKSQINSSMSAGRDPFINLVSIDAHQTAQSKFSLSNNDVFDFEEDAVRIKSQNILGETSLSAIRASNMATVFESRGYSESSKEAQKLSDFLNDFDGPKGKVQLGSIGTITTKKFRVLRDIEIPKRIIGTAKEFYVRMKPIVKGLGTTDSLVEPSSIGFTVKHKDQIQQLIVPVVPPTIMVKENNMGKITLRVTSNDPTSYDIKVIRKVYDPRTRIFSHVKTSLASSNFLVIDQEVPNIAPNKVYYSAVMLDAQKMSGPSSSLVVDGIINPNCLAKEDDQSMTLYSTNHRTGVRVHVENIPADVQKVRILREHMSGIGDYKSKLAVIGNDTSFNLETSKSRNITVTDGGTSPGHRYRYYVAAQERRGLGYVSEADTIIERKYPSSLPYEVYCGSPSVQSSDPTLVIGIELSVAHKQENYEFFMKLLKNSGADKSFLDEIKKNRKYLADVIAFNIDRIDTLTGKKVNLGLRGPGVFVDGSSSTGGSGLQSGRKYVYVIRVCVKPVQSFFARLFSGIQSEKQTSGTKITTFMTKKFLDSANRFLGALPSDSELREGGNPSQELAASDTGLTFTKTIKVPKLRAKVTDLKRVTSHLSRDNTLRLSFKLLGGPKNEVLKAFIYCKTKAGRKCIGSMDIDPDADMHYFIENIKYNDVGIKTYTVKLLYNDLKTSGHSAEYVVDRPNSILPSFVGSKILELKY